jgi:Predicted 3'-5' exonuclease related to the exonuclease domain of PolB
MLDVCLKHDPYGLNIFDLETCREYENLPQDPDNSCYQAWKYLRRKEGEFEYDQLNASYREKASLYPEFAKVIAASFCWIDKDSGELKFKSFYDRDEANLLDQIILFVQIIQDLNRKLAGMAIIGYDIPLLAKRCLAHGKHIPAILDIGSKKPWEVDAFDLLIVWKMTSFSSASLPMICHCLGIESPKTEELDGSMVGDLFFAPETSPGDNLKLISAYCDRDVISVGRIVVKLFGLD